ncbi:unnamed protein product [Schistosoma margrebowiei]|uniref:Pre-mRNA-processing factor 19 n=1 Tax=Schistosoma margrebowiei TaxID=48269 RepID=A0A183M2M7_9TREM|nr:unnamed protein product [Schistosoma margrebowiei]
MVVGGSQQETLDPGFVLLGTLNLEEVTAAREALATLKPQAGIIQPSQMNVQNINTTHQPPAGTAPTVPPSLDTSDNSSTVDSNQLQEEIGISEDVINTLQERASQLTAERKRRGKTVPEGLARSRAISEYQQLANHVGLHSASMPGINCLDISKTSPERIVTGGNDKTAVVFDLSTSQVISILKGHNKKVTQVVYHPSEELVFTGSPDTTLRVWGVEQGQCASIIRAHKGPVTGLSIHATGDYLLSCSSDGQWAFSDLRHGRVLVRISAVDKSGSIQALTCAQFHPDGLILGTGTADGEVKIWDVKERRNVANFAHGSGTNQLVTAVAFSENGYYLATSGGDSQVKLWDLRKLKNFKTLIPGEDQPSYEICDVEFDQSGSYLAVAGTDVRVYLCKQWDQLISFNAHTAPATGVRFGENATTVISASRDRSVKVFGT